MTDQQSPRPVVTAVGRILKPKHGEKRVFSIIKGKPDGTYTEVIRKELN